METHVVRKYSNRKLYDTQSRRYVTLDVIRELLRAGHDVRVVDRTSGEDITSVTLSQILLDMGRQRQSSLPQPVLVDLVKQRGDQLLGSVRAALTLPKDITSRAAGGVGGAATRTATTLETRVDDVVTAGLRNLNIATAEDVAELERRVEELSARVAELLERSVAPRQPGSRRRAG